MDFSGTIYHVAKLAWTKNFLPSIKDLKLLDLLPWVQYGIKTRPRDRQSQNVLIILTDW